MKRFILLLVLVFLFFVSKPLWIGPVQESIPPSVSDDIRSAVDLVKDQVKSFSKDLSNQSNDEDKKEYKTPILKEPHDQLFSINNIELGESKAEVERKLGKPQRVSMSEYGVNWETYHDHYHNFFMIAYDKNNKVGGMFTNQNLISSSIGIKWGSSKELAEQNLGTPETYIRKGLVRYEINSHGEYDVFRHGDSVITVFYDIHDGNKVTAIQVIDKKLEENNPDFYAKPSAALEKGFEYQLFDLTNASRVNHGLAVLKWDDRVADTARKHSVDMAGHHYFSHVNLQNQSPFDRMKKDGIPFTAAGENIAYGQFSSIFAHEGLMNSLGHRKNILQKDFQYLGIGVSFNDQSQPFYTEDFYNN
ncbi:MAG: CAP domain-containing protein [Tuberibacillus sp.]